MTETRQYTILFVCSGNTCRSPMAEYALRSLIDRERPGKARVMSAGTLGLAGQPATRYAQVAAKMWDLDLTEHRNQPLTPELIDGANLVFAMAPEHHRQVLELVPDAVDRTYLFKNFPDLSGVGDKVEDPIGMDLQAYNEVFLEIGEYLGKYLPELIARLDGWQNAE